MFPILLLTLASASEYRRRDICPVLSCSSFLETTTCGSLDYTDYSYLAQPCGLGYSCEPPIATVDQDKLECVPSEDLYGFDYTTPMQLDLRYHSPGKLGLVGVPGGMVIRSLGDICYSADSWCARDQGYICQCKDQCRCVVAGQENDQCSNSKVGDYPGCAWGLGCYQNYCVPWFSINLSVQVSDPWLCASMKTYDDGSCVQAESSAWNVTEPCTTSADCEGSNGSKGECVCGMLGQAYCTPFALDAPYVQLQTAIVNADLQKHAYWRMLIDNWAFVQRSNGRGGWIDHPSCVNGIWPELNVYLENLTYHVDVQFSAAAVLLYTLLSLVAFS